jgi:hypothetical protein
MNNARSQLAPSQNGTQTAVFAMGGSNPAISGVGVKVENYDGTSWSSRPSLAETTRVAGGFATATDAVAAGGYNGSSNLSTTEEFTAETTALNVKTLTQS